MLRRGSVAACTSRRAVAVAKGEAAPASRCARSRTAGRSGIESAQWHGQPAMEHTRWFPSADLGGPAAALLNRGQLTSRPRRGAERSGEAGELGDGGWDDAGLD